MSIIVTGACLYVVFGALLTQITMEHLADYHDDSGNDPVLCVLFSSDLPSQARFIKVVFMAVFTLFWPVVIGAAICDEISHQFRRRNDDEQ